MSGVLEAKADLDGRISEVLRGAGDSMAAADVLASLDVEATALTGDIAEARKDALSPLLDAKDAVKAKALLDDLTFRHDRLAAARTALVARVEELRASEQKAKLDAEREAALAERDALVTVLQDEVPSLIRRWTELVRDIDASDARLAKAGVHEGAEAIARGYPSNGYWPDGGGAVSRMRHAKIPSFTGNRTAWRDDGMNGRTIWTALDT